MISASVSFGSYDYSEVARSALIAIAASYAGLDLAGRVTAASSRVRTAWLASGATAIGISVWALQFKGVLALSPPAPVAYHWPKVLASLLVAIIVAALALQLISRQKVGPTEALTVGVIVGGGIAGVHYLFVSALNVPSAIHFSPLLVAISILLPILFSWIALMWTFDPRAGGSMAVRRRLGGATVIGIGLCAMRYTSIAAISFTPPSPTLPNPLSAALGDNGGAVAALIVIAVAIVTSSVDRHADTEIQRLNQELENRVTERTAQIRAVNTKLAESEERFRKLVEALPDAVMVHGENKILFVNPSCMRLLGAQRAEQLLGKDVLEILHPDYREAVQHCIQLCLETGTACPARESVFLALDGAEVQVEAAAIVIPWKGLQAVEVIVRDVRRRKHAEERLREYEKAVEGLEEMIVVVDRGYRYMLANRAFLNRRGMEREHLLGRTVPEVLEKEVFETIVKPKLDESFQGKAVTYEMKYSYPQFGERDLLIAYFPIEGAHGVDRVVSVMRDVTERKKAEGALRQSEERFRLAAQAGKMFAYEWDAASDGIVRSKESARILGIDETQKITAQQMLTRVHPDDRERLRVAVAALTPQEPYLQIAYRVVRPDGSVIWVERSSRAHFEEGGGGLLRIVGMVTDITERKHAEQSLQMFRMLIDQSNDAIEVIDPLTLRFVDINERGCLDLGYTREEFLSLSVYDIDPSVDESKFERITRELQESASALFESLHRRKDGSTFPVEVSIKQVQLDRTYRISVVRDITERKRADRTIQEARSELARVTRFAALAELTASIAHEINQPLAAVVTNGSASLRWLAAHPPNLEEAREAIAGTVREANRASDVIERIRALMGKAPPLMERIDVNAAIREVLTLSDSELTKGGIRVRTELRDVPQVLGDRVQLRQVMLNLILNGIDAMSQISDRPRELLIKSSSHPDGVIVQVHDSGKGVDPEQAERIFESFFTTKPQGIGVGLSLSRSIVEAHGGRLWTVAQPGDGAVFEFTIPKAD
jgi:PAS domain S-box-containing protein